MGREYSWGENPFRDYLIRLAGTEVDISKENVKKDIFSIFSYILENLIDKPSDTTHLSFDIKKNKEYYKISADNILSALWLTGIFVSSTKDMLKNNRIMLEGQEYVYDEKTKKLTINQIK